jgi:hypothetical protein
MPPLADPAQAMLAGAAEADALRQRRRWTLAIGAVGLAAVVVTAHELRWPTGILPTIVAYATLVGTIWLYLRKQYDDTVTALRGKFTEQERLAVALKAEILNNSRQARRIYSAQSHAAILQRMRQDADYIPFAAVDDAGARVYQALLDRIVILPRGVVSAVVRYYDADSGLDASFRALNTPAFRSLEPHRREIFVNALLLSTGEVYPIGGDRRSATHAMCAVKGLHGHIKLCRREINALRQRQP